MREMIGQCESNIRELQQLQVSSHVTSLLPVEYIQSVGYYYGKLSIFSPKTIVNNIIGMIRCTSYCWPVLVQCFLLVASESFGPACYCLIVNASRGC